MSPKLLGHVRAVAMLWALYLGVSGHFGLANLVAGLFVSVAISALVGPPEWRLGAGGVVGAVRAGWVYAYTLLIDIAKCGYDVTQRTLQRDPNIAPGIIAVRPHANSAAVTAISAHGITVTPGEMVVAIGEDGTLYAHCLDVTTSGASAQGGQETREARLAPVLSVVTETQAD